MSLSIIKSKFLDGLYHLKDDFCTVLTSSMPVLSFVRLLIFKVKSSNTVTTSDNYIKYLKLINQPVSNIQFIVKIRAGGGPQLCPGFSLAKELFRDPGLFFKPQHFHLVSLDGGLSSKVRYLLFMV